MNQFYRIDNSLPILHQQDHYFGSSNAPIVLLEYGDYACQRSCECYFLIKQLQKQFTDCILYVFRHFPQTDRDSQSQKAAETAEAAGTQNQFWQMHDLLCQNSHSLADADLVQYAVQLNLEIPQILEELSEHVHRNRVQSDIDSGQQNGVQDTPALFLSVRCQPGQDLKALVQGILQSLSGQISQ
jgi:protein-disulfide isomerase